MAAERSRWQRPELIVFTRNRLEEAVLVACKYLTNTTQDPGQVQGGCSNGPTGRCKPCKAAGNT